MLDNSSAQIARSFALYPERAEAPHGAVPGPVGPAHGHNPPVVIVEAAEWERLKRRDKQALAIEDLPEDLVDRIAATTMDPGFNGLNGT